MSEDKACRSEFEAWCKQRSQNVTRDDRPDFADGYLNLNTQCFWVGWQAGRAAKPAVTEGWRRITKSGQVKVGTKLRFTIGDKKYSETAKQILEAGTDKEEIIYNKRQNYYLITSMAIHNQGSQKNVEFLIAAAPTPPETAKEQDQ